MRRSLFVLLLAAACVGLSFLLPQRDANTRLEEAAAVLQQHVDARAALMDDIAARIASRSSTPDRQERLSALLPEGLGVWVFRSDTLLAWSGTLAIDEDSLRTLNAAHLRVGSSVMLHARLPLPDGMVHLAAEAWNGPPFTNSYLRPAFATWLHAPSGLVAEPGPGLGPVVRDREGNVLFRLAWADDANGFDDRDTARLVLRVLAIVLLVAACWLFLWRLVDRGRPGAASFLFMALIAVLRAASLQLYPISPFDRLELFGPELYAASAWLPSLGDLLIDAVLALVVARFMHLALRHARKPPMALSLGLVGAVLLSGWWITGAFIGLVEDSSVDLDLFHLQDLNIHSVLALVCVALLFTSWALFCDSVATLLLPARTPRKALVLLVTALSTSVIVHDLAGVVDLILVLWPVPVIATVIHGRLRGYRLGHALLGLATFAFLGAHVLIKYTQRREHHERLALAERLVTNDDPVVELLFRETAPRLRNDPAVHALLSDTVPCTAADLDALVRQVYFSGYWERYDVRLYAFGTDGHERCATSSEPPRSLVGDAGRFTTTLPIADMPELFRDASPGERTFYHARVAVMASDTSQPAQVVIELHPRITTGAQGFPDLLLNDIGGLSRRADRYAFARYDGGTLIESRGFAFPLHWTAPVDDDGTASLLLDGNDLLAYGDAQRSLVVLAAPSFGFMDAATTFSWLFAFFSLLLALAYGLRGAMRGPSGAGPGLGGKVRLALLVFAGLGLVLFSVGAQRLLSRLYGERSDAALLEKSRSVLVELRQKLDGTETLGPEQAAYLDHLLGRSGNVFFTDVNLYAPNGRLLATSRPQVFDAGLLGRRMDPVAFTRMAIEGRSEFVHVEHIGTARYRSAYLPLRDRRGHLQAYLNLPSFARQGEMDRERGTLLTAIVNLFVLLFALSLLAGVFISAWTIRPLDLLKRGLSRIALQGANEPIAYSGRDEVGELVRVYNRKVDELRDSAEKLARSERESAWKEMARQVAHEIKNPLTPMRLSVQHFERTWDPGATDAKERLARFTAGMVQQIDALSRIAGEFSAFAQMPQPQPSVFDLREVARAGVELFAGQQGIGVSLHAPEALPVHADREHLLRAVNNLLKNAVQSIPEGRIGRIQVMLAREGPHVLLSVADNGSGIPDDARDRIFTPSFTTKSSGMGLGLAMVKRIAEQAGGSVRFSSSLEGTTFVLELPLCP